MNPLANPTSPFQRPGSPFQNPGRSLVTFPNQTFGPSVGTTDPAMLSVLAAGGIPATALDAYQRAAAGANPSCGITWPLLAAIGRVESNHGRFAGAILHSDGVSTPPIIGIRLDGSSSVVVRDTDGGRLDGDPIYDHAVGPMQFLPSTWAVYRADGNGDGIYDPFNIYDAAAAAANYLCQAGGGNLRTGAAQERAVWSYNPSTAYVSEVLALEAAYAAGTGIVVPVPPAIVQPLPPPVLPPVNPAPPLAASSSAQVGAPHASTSPTAKPAASAHPTSKPTTASSPSGSTSSSSSSAPSPAPASSSSSAASSPAPPSSSAPPSSPPSSSAPPSSSPPPSSCAAAPTPSPTPTPSTTGDSSASPTASDAPSPSPSPTATPSPSPSPC